MEQLKAVDLIRPSLDWSVIRESNVGNDEAFFSHHFRELVNDISAMAGHAFRADKPLGDQDPWVNEFPAEFYEFVNTVAHPDPRAGDWENLLRVEYERTAFVGAVILKAIDEHVLSKMMFGADDNHEQALRLGDDALLRNDGLRRSWVRAILNKNHMDDAGTVPPQLWAKVDNLTVKIGAMLLPLFNVIREASPETTAEWETFYKRLHAIVSKAAWINVAASIKTIIMVIEWATPGEPWERGQFNIWADGYEASKAQAKKFDKACGLRWSRMARVKISAVPKVTLISNRDDAKPGYMCWNVQEAQAVFYHGFLDVNVNDVAWVPLLRHVELLKHARPTWMGRVVEPFARVIVLAMLVYGLTRVLLGVIPGGIASIIPDVLPDVIPGAFRDGVPPFINALNTLGWRIWSALP